MDSRLLGNDKMNGNNVVSGSDEMNENDEKDVNGKRMERILSSNEIVGYSIMISRLLSNDKASGREKRVFFSVLLLTSMV